MFVSPCRGWFAVRRLVVQGCCCITTAIAAAAEPGSALTLGVITELTGPGASYGRALVQGAEMAVRDINAAGGIGGRPLALRIADGGTNPARSAIAMRRLIVADVHAVVGGWGSAQVLANLEPAEQSELTYVVVGATHPDITSPRRRSVFRVIQSDAAQADILAEAVLQRLRGRRIAVIAAASAYGAGSRERFLAALARLGAEPVAVQQFAAGDQDFRVPLERIRAANPDVLAVFATVPAAPRVLEQARALGITARFVGTGGLANEALIAAAPQAAEGTLITAFFSEEADPEAAAWAERFRRENGPDASPTLAAWEYRAIRYIVAPCLARAQDDRAALRTCIAGFRGRIFGVAGEVHFDASGQLVQPPLLAEVRGGRFRLLAQR